MQWYAVLHTWLPHRMAWEAPGKTLSPPSFSHLHAGASHIQNPHIKSQAEQGCIRPSSLAATGLRVVAGRGVGLDKQRAQRPSDHCHKAAHLPGVIGSALHQSRGLASGCICAAGEAWQRLYAGAAP